MSDVLRLGTRASRMAMFQSTTVADRLEVAHPGLKVEIVQIATQGDQDRVSPLASGRVTGWFTSAIQDALTAGTIDLAVHSYKDLPTKRPPGLSIAAVPLRDDPRDAFISRGRPFRRMPQGARIGTSSPRREAQLKALRPDLDVVPIRGNVDSRIAKVDAGEYDAIVVSFSGLARIGQESRVVDVFGYEEMLPAPAQGALAVECRSDDTRTRQYLAAIDDATLRPRITAERSFLAALEAGCSYPAGAYAEEFGSTLKLNALVAPNGTIFRSKMAGPAETAAGLGRALAAELISLSGPSAT